MFLHTGTCLLALKAVKGLNISDEKRGNEIHGIEVDCNVLKSKGRKNGLIVQAAPVENYKAANAEKTLSQFMQDVISKTEMDTTGIEARNPRLRYRSLSGDWLEIEFNNFKKVNGEKIDLENWPLLGNPWMNHEVNGKKLVLEHGGEKRVYDFEKWEVYTVAADRSKGLIHLKSGPDQSLFTSFVAWMYYGDAKRAFQITTGANEESPSGSFWLAYPGSYQVPSVFNSIATDRSSAFVHKKSKSDKDECMGTGTSWKYTYHTPHYSIASQYDEVDSATNWFYKETKRTLLKWVSGSPESTMSMCQENRKQPPYSSSPANAFGYGENPYSQHLQHLGTIVGVCNVASDYRFRELYIPVPKSGSVFAKQQSGNWLFIHGGSVMVAIYTAKSNYWGADIENTDVLRSDGAKNGWIMETAEVGPYQGSSVAHTLQNFQDAVLDKERVDASGINNNNPTLRYTSVHGYTMQMTYRPHAQPTPTRIK